MCRQDRMAGSECEGGRPDREPGATGAWKDGDQAVRSHVVERLLDAVEASDRTSGLADLGVDDRTHQALLDGAQIPDLALLGSVASSTGSPLERLIAQYSDVAIRRRAAPRTTGDQADDAQVHPQGVDALVEDLARDIELLITLRTLRPRRLSPPAAADTPDDAERLAGWARSRIDAGRRPLTNLQDAAARLDAYVILLSGGARGGAEAAYLRLPGYGCGVAWAAAGDPGESARRRFTIAHEVGHHLAGDDYRAETNAEEQGESFANLFAIFLLLPRAAATAVFAQVAGSPNGSARNAAMRCSAEYGVSWSATCWHLYNLDLLSHAERNALASDSPTLQQFEQAGLHLRAEPTRTVPAEVTTAAIAAYRKRKITAARCRQISGDPGLELPELDGVPPAVVARHVFPDWLRAGPRT